MLDLFSFVPSSNTLPRLLNSQLITSCQLGFLILLCQIAIPLSICVILLAGSPQQHHSNYCGPVTVPPPMRDRPPHRGVRPLLFTKCVGSLTSHRIYICKGCETGPTVYRPYPRRLESLTVCRMSLQRQHFLLIYLRTLSVGPAGT